MIEYSYCVVDDKLDGVDSCGFPVTAGFDVLFDGGFNADGEAACNRWLAEHPEHGTAYVRPFIEFE